MGSSAGKRRREQQKREKTKIKADKKAARHATDTEPDTSSVQSESELIDDLGALQRAFEAGEVTLEDFEDRRAVLQTQFERLP